MEISPRIPDSFLDRRFEFGKPIEPAFFHKAGDVFAREFTGHPVVNRYFGPVVRAGERDGHIGQECLGAGAISLHANFFVWLDLGDFADDIESAAW